PGSRPAPFWRLWRLWRFDPPEIRRGARPAPSIPAPRAPMKGDVGVPMSVAGTSEAMDRIRALEGAVAAGAAGPEPAILGALADPSTLVRERAIALAARHLSPEALGLLLRDDDNAILRNAAFAALERQGPYAVPYLLKLTLDGNNEVAMFA